MQEGSPPPSPPRSVGLRQAPPGAEPAASRSITGNALFSLVNQVIGGAFTAGLTIFLARRLGAHGYGILSLGLGITGLVLLPSDFGTSNSVSRFVADHRGDPPRVEAVIADGLRLKLGAALAVSILMFALAGPIAGWYHAPGLAWPVRGLAIAVLGQSVMLIGGVFNAIARTELEAITAFVESAVQVTVAVALVLAGAGATGAAFGQAAGYVAGAGLTLALLVRALGPGILPRRLRFGADARAIAGYAGALLIVDGAFTVFNSIDVLIIGSYLGAAAVALFSAPLQVIVPLGYAGAAVADGVAPRLARGGAGPNVPAFIAGMRVLLIIQAFLTALVLGWAPLIVRIAFGHQYAGAAPVLRALAPYVFLNGLGALFSIGANYLGEGRKRVPVALATMGINIVLDLVLVPRLGVIGAAWGTDAAYLLYAPAHLWICRRALGLDLRATARTFARTALAGALMAGVLLVFGDSTASSGRILVTVAGGVVAVALFVLVLYLDGELTSAELAHALRALPSGRRTRRRRPR